MTESDRDVALEEMRLLQEIIGRNEGFSYQIRGWLLALLGALVAVLFADRSQLTALPFLGASWILVILFSFVELSVRVTVRQSIERVGHIEEQVRSSGAYDGPAIVRNLSENDEKNLSLSAATGEARVMGFRTFYLALLLAAGVVAYAKGPS